MPVVPFQVFHPAIRSSSVIFASPHSGRDYPRDFLAASVLDPHTIRSSEDAYVDELFASVTDHGASLLVAGAPRAFVDLNRASDELDPALIRGLRLTSHNPRVASGLGVIPRVVSNGRAIYRGKITMQEVQARLDRYWHPYHRQLQTLLNDARDQFGQALLIDCHSMPHEAIEGISRGAKRRPEVVLGDRFGAAAPADVVDQVEAAFAAADFSVVRNAPFAGAYIVQSYGRPSRRQGAIQVEIDRSLYMDEKTLRPHAGFGEIRARLARVIAELVRIGQDRIPLAAE